MDLEERRGREEGRGGGGREVRREEWREEGERKEKEGKEEEEEGRRRKGGGEEEEEGRRRGGGGREEGRRGGEERKRRRGRGGRRKEEGGKQILSLVTLHSDTPHTFTLTHSNPHTPPTHTHLVRRLFMFWGGEVHGDGPLYVLVSRLLPLALSCDHMIVVHFTLRVSGCAPIPGEV